TAARSPLLGARSASTIARSLKKGAVAAPSRKYREATPPHLRRGLFQHGRQLIHSFHATTYSTTDLFQLDAANSRCDRRAKANSNDTEPRARPFPHGGFCHSRSGMPPLRECSRAG